MSGPRSCFVITLTYVAELLAIDAVLDQHGAWLQRRYDEGIFLVSGRLEPRTGALIIAMNVTRTELETSLDDDPFRKGGLAEYDVREFVPSMASPDVGAVLGLET